MSRAFTTRHAESHADILACYDLMRQLRPRLKSEEELLAAVLRQREQGYRMLVHWSGARPVALAGYRKLDNLIHGSFIYVDDLVTNEADRGHGHGEVLLQELRNIGGALHCDQLVLDTGVANHDAQRFYSRVGLHNGALHYMQNL